MIDYIGAAAALCALVAFCVVALRFLQRSMRETHSAIAQTLSEVQRKAAPPAQDTSSTHTERLVALESEVAGIKRRQETLEDDCQRYLKRANTRLQRAEQLTGEAEDQVEEPTEAQMQEALNLMQPVPANGQPEDDLAAIRRLARERGI